MFWRPSWPITYNIRNNFTYKQDKNEGEEVFFRTWELIFQFGAGCFRSQKSVKIS